MRIVEAAIIGGLLLLASVCPAYMTATTPDGHEVIWRGVIDTHELWPSTYETWETMCAESGGMKLYARLRRQPGDYVVLYVAGGTGAWLNCRQAVTALMSDGETVVSLCLLTTESPCQYEVYDSRAMLLLPFVGNLLSPAGESVTRPGYRLVIAQFPLGSLKARPGHTWAKTPELMGFRIGGCESLTETGEVR